MNCLLPITYFGNIGYFSTMLHADKILIDKHEHFIKQTYRNRCEIYGANGKLALIVPIRHGRKEHTPVSECLIDNSTRWQTLHLRSIESGYRRSPYFEYYEDRFIPFFQKKYDSLYELCIDSLHLSLSFLKTEINFSFTESYQKEIISFTDFRPFADPKIKQSEHPINYFQVFENKYGKINNLSVLDILFNEGPQALQLLKN
jgi:hypothetical protein